MKISLELSRSAHLCKLLFILILLLLMSPSLRPPQSTTWVQYKKATLSCATGMPWRVKTCMCSRCIIAGNAVLIPCEGQTLHEVDELPQTVMIDVGGYHSSPLLVEVRCMHDNQFVNSTNLKGTSFLIGRTGPWNQAGGGLHARTIYDNLLPMIQALLTFLHPSEIKNINVLVTSRPDDLPTWELMKPYLHTLGMAPVLLGDFGSADEPLLVEKLVFGIGGRGFMSSFRYPSSLGKRTHESLQTHFWLTKYNQSTFGHSGLVIPVEDLYGQFCSYRFYRQTVYNQLQIETRKVTKYERFLVSGRTGQRQWPFPAENLVHILAKVFPEATVETCDFDGKSLAEQVRITSQADVFIAMHGSNIINSIFLQDGTLFTVFYPNSACFHQTDHVNRLVYWSTYKNFTFGPNMDFSQANYSCGIYGARCCNRVIPVSAEQVSNMVVAEVKRKKRFSNGYHCSFGESSEDCYKVSQTHLACT